MKLIILLLYKWKKIRSNLFSYEMNIHREKEYIKKINNTVQSVLFSQKYFLKKMKWINFYTKIEFLMHFISGSLCKHDYYSLLGIQKGASSSDIKKAYYKVSIYCRVLSIIIMILKIKIVSLVRWLREFAWN